MCDNLTITAQVKAGEVVLAHAGASGVGTAAVQLARLFGAVPIVTAGSPEKLKMAEDLGAAAGFHYKEESFAQRVHDFTGGEQRSCTENFSCHCIANLSVSHFVSGQLSVYQVFLCRAVHIGARQNKYFHIEKCKIQGKCIIYLLYMYLFIEFINPHKKSDSDYAGKGANVILDCIGGQNWEQNVSCLAVDGRWVLYGTMGGRTVEGDILGKLLSKRGHLLASLLRSRSLQVGKAAR